MFDGYKRRQSAWAMSKTRQFAAVQALTIAFVFTIMFRNIFAGLGGGLATFVLALWWWRADGPGRRHRARRGGNTGTP